jgi:dimethylsulfone monooxygenase
MDPRGRTNPIFGDNRLKLGLFGTNVSGGCAMTTAEGALEITWPKVRSLARTADALGFEAVVPVARWRGFGGETNFNGTCFETYTWAAGLAAETRRAAVFSTSHVPTIHPIVAAKQASTVDHISGGRFGLNVVCGWFATELEMFGAPKMEHDTAYDYAEEWLEIVRRLWTAEEEFDFEGRFFRIKRGFAQPKPIQRPFPAVMNAGNSPRGQRFAAQWADMMFVGVGRRTHDERKQVIGDLRRMARADFGREIGVWGNCWIVCRPTEREARDYVRYYVEERGDWAAADNLALGHGVGPGSRPPEQLRAYKAAFIAGWGGLGLVGTPEQIVDEFVRLAEAGVDGCLLSWVDYDAGLDLFGREILPLLEQAGLRRPLR